MLALGFVCAHAEKADKDKPMNVVADSLKYDDLKQVSIFEGRVVVTKGTLIIHADRLEVRQDPQGNQFGFAQGMGGQKATFRQKRDKPDEWLEGEAHTLNYNGKDDRMEFTGQAVIRRLRGTAVADESMGHVVVYENRTDTFSVDGGKPGTAVATGQNPTGRVRAVLTPQSAFSAAVVAPVSGVALKSSAGMEVVKK
jgi:lipopolysaccharide export system protein LptA